MNRKAALVVLIIAILVVACTNPEGPELGTLEISTAPGDPGAVRTIATPPGYTVTSYRVHGTSDESEFTRTVGADETTVTEVGLETGEWAIRVDAFDRNEIVLTGTTSVTVRGGVITSAEVVLTEPEGTGSFSFELRWPMGQVTRPAVDATLTPLGGEVEEIEFNTGRVFLSNVARYQAELPTGFYVLTVQLRDRGTVVWGNAYAIRIYRGTLASEKVNLPGAIF